LSNSKGKALMYDHTADAFRNRETTLHSFATFNQLASIEGSTLRAPESEPDDRADAYALGCTAARMRVPSPYFEGDVVWNHELDPYRYGSRDVIRHGDIEIWFDDTESDIRPWYLWPPGD
jgi:hypothetical protein